MNTKKRLILVVVMACALGGTMVTGNVVSEIQARKLVFNNTKLKNPNEIVVYHDSERAVTMSKEDYDALSQEDKDGLESKYKILFKRLESKGIN